MSDIKNPQAVKRNLDEVENMLGIIQLAMLWQDFKD